MDKQLIVFCSNYRRELESLDLEKSFDNIETTYIPNRCGLPPIEWKSILKSLPDAGEKRELHVIGCGGIVGVPAEQLITGSQCGDNFKQCYHLVITPDLADHFIQKGFYLVTPGWLSHWDEILNSWGFDQAGAVSFFKEETNAILLLDTGVDPQAEANLVEFANYVNRPFETVQVGTEHLKLIVSNRLLESRAASSSRLEKVAVTGNQKEFADFAMTLDLLNSLARMREEIVVIEKIKDMFAMLFAPREVKYRPVTDGKPIERSENDDIADGFTLKVEGSSGLLGYLDIVEVNQPQCLDQYKKLADRIVNICGLALENARHYQTIKDLSYTDGLTGIFNRRKLEEHLEQEWRRMLREKRPLTIMMCDIDCFKHYNDKYGHQAGDDCLKAVASVLASHSRRSGDLAARYGGEEFTLVLPGIDEDSAYIQAEKIRSKVEALKLEHAGSAVSDYVTLSIGMATRIPTAELTVKKLIAAADQALYSAKEAGRNRVVTS